MSELLASRTKLVIMHTKHWSIEKMNESIEVNEISAKNNTKKQSFELVQLSNNHFELTFSKLFASDKLNIRMKASASWA